MKILLISVNDETDPYPVTPLGVAYIAKALKNKGHTVYVLDLCFVEDAYRAVGDILKGFLPDIIGLSIRNIDNLTYKKSIFYLPGVRDIVTFIKKNTSVPIIVGGSGFSIFPEEVLRYLHLDIGIVGEGETAVSLIAEGIENGSDIYHIPNLCYISDGIFKQNNLCSDCIQNTPDRTLFDNKRYLELGGMANIQSKRGCPFRCTYCTYPNIEGNKLRLREPGPIVAELKEMKANYDIDYVFFVDDIFNFPEEHAGAVCEEIIKNCLNINWTCFATPKGMTPELAKLMKMAGCKGIEFGTDAGSEKTLKGLGKSFTLDDVAHATEYCKNIDLPAAHYVIIGGPEEDDSTLTETFTFFKKNKPTAIIALLGIRIYPNTLIYHKAIEDCIIEKDENLLEPIFYITPNMSEETLFHKVSEYAVQYHNWIVPNLDLRCNTSMLTKLRSMGRRGPLWNLFAQKNILRSEVID
ncbi:MAG: Radical SAM domain protein [Candidatus Jettenia ecosi]|uniref:Radical SAM domain protein n=1 Tax=Candidatus Jettenia ecosi TaxID=2494326 RepID=A0A533QMC8_9BACT|nr:MAG: Radical SAM domain protein [Candidatus Jettenia ecosi]